MPRKTVDEIDTANELRHLQELIAALDRRVAHIERSGEVAIARDAAGLKEHALLRIAFLESSVWTKGVRH